MNKPKRYCTGIDCAWCGEKEPCIYRIANGLEEENVKLKIELDQLKETNGSLLSIQYKLADSNTKLRQTLTEIKEIAEENMRIADLEGLNGVYRRGLAKQILQIISEEIKDEEI